MNKIFACYNDNSIKVYQAFNHDIADEALDLNTFGKRFSLTRMSWIKPSFLWMMYRSNWAQSENQERVLGINIKKKYFDLLLSKAVLSVYVQEIYKERQLWKEQIASSDVRCQFDPDRDIYGKPINRRAIQIGIRNEMLFEYKRNIISIEDITPQVKSLKNAIDTGKFDASMLPVEIEYPVFDNDTKQRLNLKY